MNVAKTVLKNVASSWIGLACQIVVTLILTPFVIAKLGTEAYGVWLLIQSMVGYYGMLDMGLRAGLTQSITRRIAAGDNDSVRRHIAAAIPLLLGFGIAILVVAFAVGVLLPYAVDMTGDIAHLVLPVVLVQAIGVAIKMPIAPYGSVLVGLQRYDIANAISVATRVVFAVLTWQALSAGMGLFGLAMILAITDCIDAAIRVAVARRLLPEIKHCGVTFDRTELKEIASVSGWNFMIGICRQLIYFSDATVVAVLFSAKAVAPYGIAGALVEYGTKVVVTGTKVLFPSMSHLIKNGSKESIAELYSTSTRIVLGISLTLLIVGSTWVSPFLHLWLGDSADAKQLSSQVPVIYVVLSIAFTFVGLQRVGTQLMLAEGLLKPISIFLTAEAAINLVASVIAGKLMGPVGIAAGTMVAAFLTGLFLHFPAHAKILGQTKWKLLADIASRPIIYGILLSGTMLALHSLLGNSATWPQLFVAGSLSAMISLLFFPILLSTSQILHLKVAVTAKIRTVIRRGDQSADRSDTATKPSNTTSV
ncbi:hypothetical protein Poly51_32010 [Rubripirellula tenax]|uniref:Polysaccharide biosynthesis protein n=1 Tax=Rubripirellula tenax TaxID=2528015 RepID=A0A5C6EZL4_9BACT|nr:MATE family efflux transporter [Rubripirellula tenax]TWU54482.1 hypothetical protein Poly51_32010 [Rubripirellula tenax]